MLRKLLKSENILIPPYLDVSRYRTDITISDELQFILNQSEHAIEIRIPYGRILQQTVSRLLQILPKCMKLNFL